MKVTYFKSPSDFRTWLERHHAEAQVLWVGYHKRASGKPSMTWPESVDEALCFGWIDGIRKSVDETSYTIRFTPRRRGSTWSAVNIKRAQELIKVGRMRPAGLMDFQVRKENRSRLYSYEQEGQKLGDAYEQRLKDNKKAWEFFQAQAPWYRKVVIYWVTSAKKEETRLRRLDQLIAHSAQGRTIPPLSRSKKPK